MSTPEGSVGQGQIGIIPVTSSGSTAFDITFPLQSAEGSYALVIGPDITDVSGNPMAAPYTATFAIDRTGPRVVSVAPSTSSTVEPPVSYADIVFDTPVASSSVQAGDVSLRAPDGTVLLGTGVTRLSDTLYRATFAAQTVPGAYTLMAGPNITDMVGNPMDQDADGVNGEPVHDVFTEQFFISQHADLAVTTIAGPTGLIVGNPAQVQVSWTVRNQGPVQTGTSHWVDRVFFSPNAVVGDGDDGADQRSPLAFTSRSLRTSASGS